ncbi:PTS sugar transporter subunit IIB [Tepidanaerobacter syntrophicus]|uniref:PTS system, mannose-specific IIB component n=1 Tax=Tepidanaerobacter syntrophicus TaxID=224999 RepID=A0A0U9HM37_9FIRM|nr:PTS sugar transporter subunit IIB [Tepidanaerobacter syntrophicus]GAQ24897.1 PTS system, mannose-specific IIB component [Tepidanaerobacter syntrophicus]
MIKLFRVDHRLLHGQVAFSWCNAINANAILIASDDATTNEIRKTTIKLAKPAGIKLVIKNVEDAAETINSGVTNKYNLIIIVESIKDAYRLLEKTEEIKSLNLGGTKKIEGSEQLSKALYLTEEDKKLLRKILEKGIEVEIRQVPTDSKRILTLEML